MPKIKHGVAGDPNADGGTGNFYDGPVPPRGVYAVDVKRLRMKKNKNDDYMINGVGEIHETGKKKQFNGYGIWFNVNVTDKSSGFVNNFLDAFGFSRKAFWDSDIMVDSSPEMMITRIGRKKVDPDGSLRCRINARTGSYNGEAKLEVNGAGFLPVAVEEPDDADEEPDYDDEEDEEDEEADDEEDDGEPPF